MPRHGIEVRRRRQAQREQHEERKRQHRRDMETVSQLIRNRKRGEGSRRFRLSKNETRAVELLETACGSGAASGCFQLSSLLERGFRPPAVDVPRMLQAASQRVRSKVRETGGVGLVSLLEDLERAGAANELAGQAMDRAVLLHPRLHALQDEPALAMGGQRWESLTGAHEALVRAAGAGHRDARMTLARRLGRPQGRYASAWGRRVGAWAQVALGRSGAGLLHGAGSMVGVEGSGGVAERVVAPVSHRIAVPSMLGAPWVLPGTPGLPAPRLARASTTSCADIQLASRTGSASSGCAHASPDAATWHALLEWLGIKHRPTRRSSDIGMSSELPTRHVDGAGTSRPVPFAVHLGIDDHSHSSHTHGH